MKMKLISVPRLLLILSGSLLCTFSFIETLRQYFKENMASVSLGAVSFLPPSSLHSVPPSQPKQNPHHRMLEVNRGQHNSNITVSFSNPSAAQGMHILEDEDAGEP